jgi:hypothetical protein
LRPSVQPNLPKDQERKEIRAAAAKATLSDSPVKLRPAAQKEIIAAGEDLIEASHEPSALTARLVAAGGIERLDEIVAGDSRAHATRLEIGSAADDAIAHIVELMQIPSRRAVNRGFASSTSWHRATSLGTWSRSPVGPAFVFADVRLL